MSTEVLYSITKAEPWSDVILRRRLSWLGHLLRLPEETPARIALSEAITPAKRPRGKPRTIWISCIKKDLIKLNIVSKSDTIDNKTFFDHLTELTANRNSWNQKIRSAISEYQRMR